MLLSLRNGAAKDATISKYNQVTISVDIPYNFYVFNFMEYRAFFHKKKKLYIYIYYRLRYDMKLVRGFEGFELGTA